jgi:hypothetical protein
MNNPRQTHAQAFADALRDSGCPTLAQEMNTATIEFDATAFIASMKGDPTINQAFTQFIHILEEKWSTKNAELTVRNSNLMAKDLELAAKEAELLATIATSDNNTTAFNAQIALLTSQLGTAQDRLTRAAPSESVTIKDPEIFTGNEKDTAKRQTEYTAWRSKINFRHHLDTTRFTSEYAKIIHIGSLLGGNALLAHKAALDNVVNNKNDPTRWTWQSARDFFAALDRQYDNLDLAALAQRELAELTQGGTPFHDFLTNFIVLADRCGYNNAQRVQTIKPKLNNKMKHALVSVYPTPAADNWDEWVQVFRGIAENLANLEHQKRLNSGNNNTQNRPVTNTPQAGDPMDLDRIHINRITREEMAYRIANNLCKRCGGPGHYAINCDGKGNVVDRGRGRGSYPSRGIGRGWPQTGRGGGRGAAPAHLAAARPQQIQWTTQPPSQTTTADTAYLAPTPNRPHLRPATYTPGFVVADLDTASSTGYSNTPVMTPPGSASHTPPPAPYDTDHNRYITGAPHEQLKE